MHYLTPMLDQCHDVLKRVIFLSLFRLTMERNQIGVGTSGPAQIYILIINSFTPDIHTAISSVPDAFVSKSTWVASAVC